MLRFALPLLLLPVIACSSPPTQPLAATDPDVADTGPEPEPDWEQMPDAANLRSEFGLREDFAERCERDRPLREAFELLTSKSWLQLLSVSGEHLAGCPVDIDFHLLKAIALRELGRERESHLHREWNRLLVNSVLASGSGDSSDSPWVVISVGEEYSILRALGMERKSQALIEGGIDHLTVELDGEERSVYFFPGAHWVRLERAFSEVESK